MYIFFIKNCNLLIPIASLNDAQATGEAFSILNADPDPAIQIKKNADPHGSTTLLFTRANSFFPILFLVVKKSFDFLHVFARRPLYLAVAAGVAGLAGARVVVDPVHAGRLVQARALRALVNVVLAIRP